jgi:hypothetical protein
VGPEQVARRKMKRLCPLRNLGAFPGGNGFRNSRPEGTGSASVVAPSPPAILRPSPCPSAARARFLPVRLSPSTRERLLSPWQKDVQECPRPTPRNALTAAPPGEQSDS